MLWVMKEMHEKDVENDKLLSKLEENANAKESKIKKADDDPGPKRISITTPAKELLRPGKEKEALVPRNFHGDELGLVTHGVMDQKGNYIDKAHGLPDITQQSPAKRFAWREIDQRSLNTLGGGHIEVSDCLASFFCVLGAVLVIATALFVAMTVFKYRPSWYHTKRRVVKLDVEGGKQWNSGNQQMQVPFRPLICSRFAASNILPGTKRQTQPQTIPP